jgi:hypothetical protein
MATKRKTTDIEPTAAPKNTASKAEQDRQLHAKLKSFFELEHMRQQVNRYQMALDCDYVDGDQWLPHEAAVVRSRGQNPVVHNEIKPTIDWLIGTERRMRRDFKVLARHSKAKEAADDAELKTQYLKYLADVNRAPWSRSQAAHDQFCAGLGWIEVGVLADPEDEPIYIRHESWLNMLHDSISAIHSPDPKDWRYIFRFKEIDLDVAEAYFPGKEQELKRAATMGDWWAPDQDWHGAWPSERVSGTSNMPMRWISYNPESDILNPRPRVSIVECWYRAPTKATTGAGKGGSHDRTKMGMRVALMTKHDLLLDIESPYAHNRFPFIPIWAYRRKSDGLPYGPVRNIRGPQDSLNKSLSKAEFRLSVNQMRLEDGAIDEEVMGLEELRDEAAAPDGIPIFAKGALSGGKVQFREGAPLAQGDLMFAERMGQAIRAVAGVSMEQRGMSATGASGKAILAKHDQGQMVTAELFDNQLWSHQLEGEITISLCEQFVTEEKTFSVTGERYKLDYFTLNQPNPMTGQILNDVTAHKAQFVIGEAPWRQSLGEAAFESAMNMLGQLAPTAPQVVTAIIDLVFEWADMPNKQEILKRIRSVTNVPDPDKGESPEQEQQKAMQAQLAQAKFEAEMAQMQAVVREAQGKGAKLEADAMAKRLETLYMAAQAAQVITTAPVIAPVADELARSVGFKDEAGDGALNGAVPQQAAPQPPIPEAVQADGSMAGAQAGIESPEITGVQPGVA